MCPQSAVLSSYEEPDATYKKQEAVFEERNNKDGYFYYLNADARKNLLDYQYCGSDNSILYQYILSPFALFCVNNFVPETVAPNSITFFGLLWMISSYLVCWWYAPSLIVAEDAPQWIFLWNAISLFAYQTLDNMDGKQARKTGSSSPLGLLFDHGCDAINSIFGSANWIIAMGLSLEEDMLSASVLVMLPFILFYVATWEEYYIGELILPVFNGPSEGLLLGAAFHMTTYFKGTGFWIGTEWYEKFQFFLPSFMMPDQPIRNMDLVVLATVVGGIQELTFRIIHVSKKHSGSMKSLIPIVVFSFGFFAIGFNNPEVWLANPRTGLHLSMILFVEITTALMLAHMTHQKFQPLRWQLLPLAVLGIMSWTTDMDNILVQSWISAYTWSMGAYLAMKMVQVIHESCAVLNIWCFDIVTPRQSLSTGAGKGN